VPEAGFHFEQPLWFLGLLALIPVALWLWRSAARAARGPIHRYADAHLLPHLTGTRELKAQERWGRFLSWSLLWTLLLAAMAGPRWDYTDVRLFHPGNNLLILLDVSRSMQVADVAPSRLARARQEIQDLIMLDRDVRLGLIAFASVPHVISPVTEDTYTVLNALPALSTDLAEFQGSRVGTALERAETLLNGLPAESSRAILLITDGDFDEPELTEQVRKLAAEGIRLHVLGIGTEQGARVPAPPRPRPGVGSPTAPASPWCPPSTQPCWKAWPRQARASMWSPITATTTAATSSAPHRSPSSRPRPGTSAPASGMNATTCRCWPS